MINKAEVWFKNASSPKLYEDVNDIYEEGSYTCILFKKEKSVEKYKYPTNDIFRIIERTI